MVNPCEIEHCEVEGTHLLKVEVEGKTILIPLCPPHASAFQRRVAEQFSTSNAVAAFNLYKQPVAGIMRDIQEAIDYLDNLSTRSDS